MFFDMIKNFARTLSSLAVALMAIYGVYALLSNADSVFGAARALAPVSQEAVVAATAVEDPAVPLLLNYQGTLRDIEGNPLSG